MGTHFRKRGWIYIPSSVAGWLVAAGYVAVSVITLASIEKNYNSLLNSLIRFFPYFISFSVVYFWIASNSSEKK
jgi:putative effector of murein hydrolase LrgA (UPF0299 family)